MSVAQKHNSGCNVAQNAKLVRSTWNIGNGISGPVALGLSGTRISDPAAQSVFFLLLGLIMFHLNPKTMKGLIIGLLVMMFIVGSMGFIHAKPMKPAKQCRQIGISKVKPFRMKVMPKAKPDPVAIVRPVPTAKFRS